MVKRIGQQPANERFENFTALWPCPMITEGAIDYSGKGDNDTVVIGRTQMPKSEEFSLSNISIKRIRALVKAVILVVKSG